MSIEKRSKLMARIKGRDTGPELSFARLLVHIESKYERHSSDLPGRPDFVFREEKVAIFVDGDFWHGWRFEQWKSKLSEKWEAKISANKKRDARNRLKLRRQGWSVVRIWEHELAERPDACVQRVLKAVQKGLVGSRN